MPKLRSPFPIIGLLLAGCGSDNGMTPPPTVASIVVTPLSATITGIGNTQQFTAQPLDSDGNPVSASVTWSSSTPSVATVNSSGLATAVGSGTTSIQAEAGVVGNAVLVVIAEGLNVSSATLSNARVTLTYDGTIEAEGGAGGYSFAIISGSLPTGLQLASNGEITGLPNQVETQSFTVQVTDAQNEQATRTLSLSVCEAPVPFAVGDTQSGDPAPPGTCGIFLPSGFNDAYAVGVYRPTTAVSPSDVVSISLTIDGVGVSAAVPPPARALAPLGRTRLRLDDRARRRLEIASATAAAHAQVRMAEMELFARVGTAGLLPDYRETVPLRAAGAVDLPDQLELYPTTLTSGCSTLVPKVTAVKLAENDHMGIFQDETQTPQVTPAQAQVLLDYYDQFGKEVIDRYFSGVPDVNGDGKVVVFITPAVSGETAAFVWSGDFLSGGVCPASNQMELVYMNVVIVDELLAGVEQGPETLVHEVKHISSLYERVKRQETTGLPEFNPLWLEEGVAEIAGGVASRLAFAEKPLGPAVNDFMTGDDLRAAANPIDDETLGILVRLFRTQGYLSSQPNGLVVTPNGAGEDHTIYGSGWLFSRFLGDAYGLAANARLFEDQFWAEINDRDHPGGVTGIEQATGKSWSEVLGEFAHAIMVNGAPVPQPVRAFTTYDLPSSIEIFCFAADAPIEAPCTSPGPDGFFPWPVTVNRSGNNVEMGVPFLDATFSGQLGPAGMRIHWFVSNGTGSGAEINVDAPAPSRVVVVRIN